MYILPVNSFRIQPLYLTVQFTMGDNRDEMMWDMALVASPLILQGLLTIIYCGRHNHVEAFSYPLKEWSCDTMGVDTLLVIYQL